MVSIDKTGEVIWPYGREDIAGDGSGANAADEASADLRSIYADAQADRLWLRAYVSGTVAPSDAVSVFFFLDNDARDGTGGKALGDELDPALGADPTTGGYEIAVGVAGDGSLLGTWQWNAASSRWQAVSDVKPQDVRAEAGTDTDPLTIGAALHGYVQTDLLHSISGLTATCGGTIFVRSLHAGTPQRSFGDDSPKDFACRPANDAYGDPVVLRSYACTSDDQCPADGRCREGICLFTYTCDDDDDCRAGEACTAGRCVRVVDETCNDAADCAGLVCQAGSCVACTENGARACNDGQLCSPNGSCVNPDDRPPTGGGGGGGVDEPGNVQGGPFSCSAREGGTGSLSWLLPLTMLALYRGARRRRREHAASSSARQP